MIIDDPTTNYCRSVEDICIPMITRYNQLMFVQGFGWQHHAIKWLIRIPIDH